jgi:hypothetical protein
MSHWFSISVYSERTLSPFDVITDGKRGEALLDSKDEHIRSCNSVLKDNCGPDL